LLLSETNEVDDAEKLFRKAIRLQEQLLHADATNADLLRRLAASYNNLSVVYLGSDLGKAVECYEIASRYQEQAVARNPGDLRGESDWAMTFNNLGAAQSRMELFTEAAASYDQAITIQQRLVAAAPAQRGYRGELAVSYNNRGLMQSKLSAPTDAERSFMQALELQKALVAQYPDELDLQNSLGGVYNNLGIVLEEQNRIEDAAVAYKNAVEHQRIAFANAPSVSRYRVFLSKHYYNYGRSLRQLGYPDQALRAALARRELWPNDPQKLFAVAEELALAAAALRTIASADATSKQCAGLAVETLQQAVHAGLQLPADLWNNESFASLREHEGFVKLATY
jgi:hypothetical protein